MVAATAVTDEATSAASASKAPVVDCDVHAVLPSPHSLLPYLDTYWADQLVAQLVPSYEPNYHPRGSAIAQRPEHSVDSEGRAATNVENLVQDVFADGFTDIAVLSSLYAVQQIHQPRREQAHARALNTWLAEEWLSKDDRLRGSIIVPQGTPELAAEEIAYWANDKRFVQVMLLGQSELLYGRQINWPIWEAAEAAGLPVSLHIGGVFRQAPTSVGWPATHLEWYAGQTANFEAQLNSIISEGVLAKFPKTKILLSETGAKWLPPFMWKFEKIWRSYRTEVPWVDRSVMEIIRDHVKVTTAPSDGIEEPGAIDKLVDRLGSDKMLVYSSDYPHNHKSKPRDIDNGTNNPDLLNKIYRKNAAELYSLDVKVQ